MNNWYLYRGNKVFGPFTIDELELQQPQPFESIRDGSLGEWMFAGLVPGLCPQLGLREVELAIATRALKPAIPAVAPSTRAPQPPIAVKGAKSPSTSNAWGCLPLLIIAFWVVKVAHAVGGFLALFLLILSILPVIYLMLAFGLAALKAVLGVKSDIGTVRRWWRGS